MVSPLPRRRQVELACERGLSQRRACGLVGVSRSTTRYELRMPVKDAPVINAMKTLSAQYPRYIYRRICIFLDRQGMKLSWSRTHRIWRCGRPAIAQEAPQAWHRRQQARPFTPFKANTVWAYDFVFDTLKRPGF